MAASGRWAAWLPSLVAAGVGLGVMAALFTPEMRAAVGVWSTSTAFGHCFLVLPIAAWLAWDRRALLAPLAPDPWPMAALLVAPCALAWLLAERLGLMEGRQLAALAMVWVIVPAAFGWRVAVAMVAPLAYLVFLVPFGAFLVPALQAFTAWFIDAGLGLLGIPHYVNAVLVEIPEGQFLVAEACAGLRFLIAAIAFGTLYALMIYRSPWRRLAFIAVSIAVPILANGVRALGIVLLGHALGSAQAGVVDHLVYGWLFFSAVILLLILLGLPFREDGTAFRAIPAPPVRFPRRGGALAVACVLGLSCLGPAAAWALNRRGAADTAAAGPGTPPSGCQEVAAPGPSERLFSCMAGRASVRIRRFGPRAGASLVQAELQAGESALDGEDVEHATLASADGMWRTSTDGPGRAVAASVWIDGRPSAGGLRDRLALGLASLRGGGGAPVVATVSAAGPGAGQIVQQLVRQVGPAQVGQ